MCTSPFLAANAIGRCLDIALAHVEAARSLAVTIEPLDRGGLVRVVGLVRSDDWSEELDPSDGSLGALLETIDADFASNPKRGEIVLRIGHSKSPNNGSES